MVAARGLFSFIYVFSQRLKLFLRQNFEEI